MKISRLLMVTALFLPVYSALAGTILVPDDYTTIQGAIDAASNGDEIVISIGEYPELLNIGGKNIIIRSVDAWSSYYRDNTKITGDLDSDGTGDGPVVTFSGTEDATCALMGLNIRKGRSEQGGGIVGNGTLASIQNCTVGSSEAICDSSYPCGCGGGINDCDGLIEFCYIDSNIADYDGGGLYGCDGTIRNSRINYNHASTGAGLAYCNAHIYHNMIYYNMADRSSVNGGGLYACNGTIEYNRVYQNSSDGYGGGISSCDGVIRANEVLANTAQSGAGVSACGAVIENNIIADNEATGGISSKGGGVIYCSVRVVNNTIYGNSADTKGGGMESCSGIIRNNIIWGNTAPAGAQMSGCSLPQYCCVQNWGGGGDGTITDDPLMEDPESNDYNLTSLSPCIDAGMRDNDVILDYEGHSRPIDGTTIPRGDGSDWDIGADEYSTDPSPTPTPTPTPTGTPTPSPTPSPTPTPTGSPTPTPTPSFTPMPTPTPLPVTHDIVWATGSGQYQDVALGDINRDGLLDIAASSSDSTGIHVLLADSARSFTPDSPGLPTTGNYNGVTLGDVNCDGRLDLVAASADGEGIRVFLQESGGSWTESSTGLPGLVFYGMEVMVEDFNRDGDPDIAATFSGQGVRIFKGNGEGGWSDLITLASSGSYWGLASWDWFENGKPDLIAAGHDDSGLVYWRHRHDGTWASSDFDLPHTGNYNQIALLDADYDGYLDIAATYNKGVRIFQGRDSAFPEITGKLESEEQRDGIVSGNFPPDVLPDLFQGSGTGKGIANIAGLEGLDWIRRDDLVTTGSYWGLAIGDSDADGAPDVAGAPSSGGILVCYNGCPGLAPEWNESPGPCSSPDVPASFASGDVNRDGNTDLLIGMVDGGIRLVAGDGGNSWTDITPETFPDLLTFGATLIDDFNGDFRPDVFAACTGERGLACFKNNGFGSWERMDGFSAMTPYSSIAMADFDHDGLKEIVCGTRGNGIHIYSYDSITGFWSFRTSPDDAGHYTGVAVADFNLDGTPDIAACLEGKGARVWTKGTSWTWNDYGTNFPVWSSILAVRTADVDKDGCPDLLFSRPGNGLSVYRNKRDGSWMELAAPGPAGDFTSLHTADVNFDGTIDILCSGDDKGIVLLESRGSGVWINSHHPPLPSSGIYPAACFAYLDRDATPDIVTGIPGGGCRIYSYRDGSPPGAWDHFLPGEWTNELAPTCFVDVLDSEGMDISTAEYFFTRDRGASWLGPFHAECAELPGATLATLIARDVPFNNISRSENKIRFQLRDVNGNMGISPEFTLGIETTPPDNPEFLSSTSHESEVWNRFTRLGFRWSMATDGIGSGIGGYSCSMTELPDSIPDEIPDIPHYPREYLTPSVGDGEEWYFHLRSVDKAGNAAAGAIHTGPFWIDATPPDPPVINTRDGMTTGTWYNRDILIDVDPGEDALSGRICVRYNFTQYSDSFPETGTETSWYSSIHSDALSDGTSWYCHCQTKDRAGNFSSTSHLGPFWIDRTPPSGDLLIESISGSDNFNVTARGADDLSGVDHWNLSYRAVGDPGYSSLATGLSSNPFVFVPPASTVGYELAVVFEDMAGNASETIGPFPARRGENIDVIIVEEVETAGGGTDYVERAGVKVYKNDQFVGITDASGEIHVTDVFYSDRLTALYLIEEMESLRDHHTRGSADPWKWRHYITNVQVNDDGTLEGYIVDTIRDPYTLVLRKTNALIGFNLVVSLEWDAGEDYLEHLEEGYHLANDYFYAGTDGQMIFENIEIHDNGHFWEGADIRMYLGDEWPRASVNGINRANPEKKIILPRFFDGSNTHVGPYTDSDAYRVIVHEFGHYGFALYDEYFLYDPETDTEHGAHCTDNYNDSSSRYYRNTGYAASIMNYQYTVSNFCDALPANPHLHATEQHRRRGMSCWEWIEQRFRDGSSEPGWQILRPVDHGDQVPGPDRIPSRGWYDCQIRHDADTGACDAVFHFEYEDGSPLRDAGVTLLTASGLEAFMGSTDRNGDVMLYGVHEGDRALVHRYYEGDFLFRLECPSSGGKLAGKNRAWSMVQSPLKNRVADSVNVVVQSSPYRVDVGAIPGVTTGTLEVTVSTTTTLLEPPLVMVWQEGAKFTQPAFCPVSWNSQTNLYEGSMNMEDLPDPEGFVLARTTDMEGNESLGSRRFRFISPPEAGELEWGGAESPLGIRMKASSFPGGSMLAFEQTGRPKEDSSDLFLVKGPYRLFSNTGKDLAGGACLIMSYSRDADEAKCTKADELALYKWDEAGNKWIKLNSTHIPKWNRVSAPIDSVGIYTLAAPPLRITDRKGFAMY